MKKLSIVIPVYNEKDNLEWHYQKINGYLSSQDLTYELIYVNDGSSDGSDEIIKKIAATSPNIRYIFFSRNFGKEAATTAGLHKVTGDAVIIIDADGQHPIELISDFIAKWQEGYDVIIGVRISNKGEGLVKKYGSRLFYFLIKVVTGSSDMIQGSTDFRLIDRKVINEFNSLTEHNRVTRNLVDWLGYNRYTIPFSANARHAGKAGYSFNKLLKLAVNSLVAHSTRPLKFIGVLGVAISFLSIVTGLALFIQQYLLNDPLGLAVSGVAILALFLSFLIGVVLVCQGLLALYLENVYHETQNRPLYIIREEG